MITKIKKVFSSQSLNKQVPEEKSSTHSCYSILSTMVISQPKITKHAKKKKKVETIAHTLEKVLSRNYESDQMLDSTEKKKNTSK